MTYRHFIIGISLVAVSSTGCGRALCRRDAPPRGYGPGGPAYTIPRQNIPDGPLPPLAPPPVNMNAPSANGGNAELLLPESAGSGSRSRAEYFDPLERSHRPPPAASIPDTAPPAAKSIDPDPPLSQVLKPQTPAKSAVGIASFNKVKEGVFSGKRPEIEGLDWLQANQFKTVVFLRNPSEEDITDRRQTEKRELRFVSWEITPDGLNKSFVDEFNQLIGDSAARKIFVYSTDNNMNAAIWYMHLRSAEFLTHEEARLRVSSLGLINEKSDYFQTAVKLMNEPIK